MMMMRRSLAGRSLSSTATRDVETAIPPHPSSAIHGAFDHQVVDLGGRLGQPEHDALVVVMDLSLCLMQ